MEVELDLFSGRPNPRWELNAEEAATLADRLRDLPRGLRGGEPPSLGYRGFVVHNPKRELGLPALLRIYQGVSDMAGPGSPAQYEDAHAAEPLLEAQARAHGHGPLLDQLRPPGPDR